VTSPDGIADVEIPPGHHEVMWHLELRLDAGAGTIISISEMRATTLFQLP
jgi:hypothetical protein